MHFTITFCFDNVVNILEKNDANLKVCQMKNSPQAIFSIENVKCYGDFLVTVFPTF